jgi:hypothetical protein
MALHWSFKHLQLKLWAKEGPGVKLAIWLPTTKSQESTRSQRALGECDTELESSLRGLQVWSRPHPDRRSGREAMMSQSPGKKCHSGASAAERHREYYREDGVAPPELGPWCVMWVRVSPWLVPTPNAWRMSSNQLMLVLDAGFWPSSLISS